MRPANLVGLLLVPELRRSSRFPIKMKIVLLTHPVWLESQSMPRFATMLCDGMRQRGHDVTCLSAEPKLLKILNPSSVFFRKWLGYFDQFVLFPRRLAKWTKKQENDTLFVVVDQALGIWVPVIINRPHVIHCHDFLAQRCAFGEFPNVQVGFLGKAYQAVIRRGYRYGRNFICISEATRRDLRSMHTTEHQSIVVHNPIDPRFLLNEPLAFESEKKRSYILNVGADLWYKNKAGVLLLYASLCRRYEQESKIPPDLWILGNQKPLNSFATEMPGNARVKYLPEVTTEELSKLYRGAALLLFPSLEEGFGWPILEALGSGTLVVTTDAPPMSEVGGSAATYIPRMPDSEIDRIDWSYSGALVLNHLLNLPDDERSRIIDRGKEHAQQFNIDSVLLQYESFYTHVLHSRS